MEGILLKWNFPSVRFQNSTSHPAQCPLTIHVKKSANLVYTWANRCLFSRFYSYVWFLWFSRQFGLVTDQQGHGSAGSTVLRYFLEPILGTLNGGSQDCIVIMTILMMIPHSTNYLTALLNLFFSNTFVCGMWQKTHLHFTDVGAGTQTPIANRWPIWGQYPHFWLLVQRSIYFPTMSWAMWGTPDFIDWVVCDMGQGRSGDLSPPGKEEICDSLSLSKFPKRKQLSARAGA